MLIPYFKPSKRKNLRSQIAVVITLIITAILLMTMVFINIHKVSTIKTLTSQAADRTALRTASKIGTLSKFYWNALGNQAEACGLAWAIDPWGLFKLAVVAVGTMLAFLIIPNPVVLLTGIGLFVSMAMGTAITHKFQDMSAYNAIREDALYNGIRGLQSDYVELENLYVPDKAIFQDPNPDPLDPVTQIKYNLTEIPGMIKAAKVSRFEAWYYTKRLKLVDEKVLKEGVEEFINGKEATKMDGIKKFVYIAPGDWDNVVQWRILRLSFALNGKRAPYEVGHRGEFLVTCAACPGWVVDPATYTDKIKLITIKDNNDLDETTAWFIQDKLDGSVFVPGLLRRLHRDYCFLRPLSCIQIFCDNPITCLSLTPNPIVNEGEFHSVKEDMRLLLCRMKEVLNLPVAERIRGLMQWFTDFYDPSAHNPDRTSKYNTGNYDEDNKYDVYLRINRDKVKIKKWIEGLININADIIEPAIPPDYGSYCFEGRGLPKDNCYTYINICYCNTIQYDTCGTPYTVCDPNPNACVAEEAATRYGIYGTCAGNDPYNSHPVCQNGDLYSTVPDWCSYYSRNDRCVELSNPCIAQNCSVPVENLLALITEYYYQGQMSWRAYVPGQYDCTGCPTEVRQAIEILQEWLNALEKLQAVIESLQVKIEALQAPDVLALRNSIVYAWRDKPSSSADIPQYSHIAMVQIKNYPVNLPYISESVSFAINWLASYKCRKLNDYKGIFDVEALRYDQDQPNILWNLRRRKQPLNPEYDTGILRFIVEDIQQTGKVALPREISLQAILDNYAVVSKTRVQYGPEKADVAIVNVDMK